MDCSASCCWGCKDDQVDARVEGGKVCWSCLNRLIIRLAVCSVARSLPAHKISAKTATILGRYWLFGPRSSLSDLSTIAQSWSCTTLASIKSPFIGKQLSQAGTTCVASILSRWNWHIFPRAETALSYAITLSECSALGCRITTFNLVRASAKRQKNMY